MDTSMEGSKDVFTQCWDSWELCEKTENKADKDDTEFFEESSLCEKLLGDNSLNNLKLAMSRRDKKHIFLSLDLLYNTTPHARRLIYVQSHPNTFSQRLLAFA